MERLWGDNFFDPTTKKWSKKHTGSDTCKCAMETLPIASLACGFRSKPLLKPHCSARCPADVEASSHPQSCH